MNSTQRVCAYGLGGVLLEVAFTCAKDSLYNLDPKLQGYTQLYVLPLYALGGRYVFEPMHDKLRSAPTAVRAAAYATAFFAIEAAAGLLIKELTGQCPWQYTGWGSIYEVIRITHAPVWMTLGFIAEAYRVCLEEYRLDTVGESAPIKDSIEATTEMLRSWNLHQRPQALVEHTIQASGDTLYNWWSRQNPRTLQEKCLRTSYQLLQSLSDTPEAKTLMDRSAC